MNQVLEKSWKNLPHSPRLNKHEMFSRIPIIELEKTMRAHLQILQGKFELLKLHLNLSLFTSILFEDWLL